MGYSDPTEMPAARSPVAVVDDLHTLIHAAKIATPVVLVGHSLGGFNMKLYAAIYPEDVAGLVLVDPGEERQFDRTQAIVTAKYGPGVAAKAELYSSVGVGMQIAAYDKCADLAAVKDLDPASEIYKGCTDPVRAPLGPDIAGGRVKIQVRHAYQAAQASELANSVYGDPRSDAVYAKLFVGRLFGNKPLIVLTHGIYDANNPDETTSFFAQNALHDETATLSSRGVNRIVAGTHHNIEVDQPQAIIDAVEEVLKQVAAR